MDKVKIILDNGSEAEVYSIFYLYKSKYYFIYTTKEIDANGYVVLHLVQVGKELKNTPQGVVDTGYMVGVEIPSSEEWKLVQESITKIVEDKKNNTKSPDIQYLPISMLSKLKIVSKKTFRLMKSIIENDFKLNLDEEPKLENTSGVQNVSPIYNADLNSQSNNLQQNFNSGSIPLSSINQQVAQDAVEPSIINESAVQLENDRNQENDKNSFEESISVPEADNLQQGDVIIDYRARFFEEQEKNQQLQLEISNLKQKLESIKQVIE